MAQVFDENVGHMLLKYMHIEMFMFVYNNILITKTVHACCVDCLQVHWRDRESACACQRERGINGGKLGKSQYKYIHSYIYIYIYIYIYVHIYIERERVRDGYECEEREIQNIHMNIYIERVRDRYECVECEIHNTYINKNMYTYLYVNIYICVHVYMYRERERESS